MFYPIVPNVQTCFPDQNSEGKEPDVACMCNNCYGMFSIDNSRYTNSVIYNWTHSNYFVISYFGDTALLLLDVMSVYFQCQ